MLEIGSRQVESAFARIQDVGSTSVFEPLASYQMSWDAFGVTCLSSGVRSMTPQKVSNRGADNIVFLGRDAVMPRMLRIKGERNVFFFGPFGDVSRSLVDVTGDDMVIYIGAFSQLSGFSTINARSPGSIVIGDRCYIGDRTLISNSDGHAIYDIESKTRINPNRDISIGERSFVGSDCKINKGAALEPGTIVLSGSVVSGRTRSNCVYQGVPATVQQEGVTWMQDAGSSSLDEAQSVEARREAELLEALSGDASSGRRAVG